MPQHETLPAKHFRETKEILKQIPSDKIAHWLLNDGYYPEVNVVPPSFTVDNFVLSFKECESDFSDLRKHGLISLSYPKTALTSRIFSIQHPSKYHDIVFHLKKEWDLVINHLFNVENNIFSYSFPIPISSENVGNVGDLRSGRMVYEWLEMAENDLVAEAHNYKFLVKADISNCYNSIYTHSIAWALHGIEDSRKDIGNYTLLGSKIDRLIQYANDRKTNGIPVGSALSDLINEIILAKVDREVSLKLQTLGFNYIGTRFKDDYRFLCNSNEEGLIILKELSNELNNFNLMLNETKTRYDEVPDGLYRFHIREYFPYSLKDLKKFKFKKFELTLLAALDIHTKYPGTSILEKFISELFCENGNLKICFSTYDESRGKQIQKAISLLFLLKRKSEKTIGNVLSVIEAIFDRFITDTYMKNEFKLKEFLKNIITNEIKNANNNKSTFELVWLVYFSKYLKLGITDFDKLISEDLRKNEFLKSLIESKSRLFANSNQILFTTPQNTRGIKLAKRLNIFHKEEE